MLRQRKAAREIDDSPFDEIETDTSQRGGLTDGDHIRQPA
jgi:hypothetical protein